MAGPKELLRDRSARMLVVTGDGYRHRFFLGLMAERLAADWFATVIVRGASNVRGDSCAIGRAPASPLRRKLERIGNQIAIKIDHARSRLVDACIQHAFTR